MSTAPEISSLHSEPSPFLTSIHWSHGNSQCFHDRLFVTAALSRYQPAPCPVPSCHTFNFLTLPTSRPYTLKVFVSPFSKSFFCDSMWISPVSPFDPMILTKTSASVPAMATDPVVNSIAYPVIVPALSSRMLISRSRSFPKPGSSTSSSGHPRSSRYGLPLESSRSTQRTLSPLEKCTRWFDILPLEFIAMRAGASPTRMVSPGLSSPIFCEDGWSSAVVSTFLMHL